MGRRPYSLYKLFLWTSCACLAVQAKFTPFLDMAFFFDWNPQAQPVPIPVTAQCEIIHIKWSRSAATGPNPVPPYYLQVYTSSDVFPYIIPAGNDLNFDWAVPFAPGTLYQICMFDKNGNTGGCQATYTVIPPQGGATCPNVTAPLNTLAVEGTVANGPISRYGWIDQCTDLSLVPKNGTPPYTMTIAPALHPPANITSKTRDAMNWTVSLSWAAPFFVSVVDSQGNGWANGPLHSGKGDPSCLSLDAAAKKVLVSTAVGAGFGSAILGALLALIAAYLYGKYRSRHSSGNHFALLRRSLSKDDQEINLGGLAYSQASGHRVAETDANHTAQLRPLRPTGVPPSGGRGPEFQIEPFVVTTDSTSLQPGNYRSPSSDSPSNVSYTSGALRSDVGPPTSPSNSTQRSHVYVVHHDAGRPPVTVYTEQGTEVVELPPVYVDSPETNGRSNATTVKSRPSRRPLPNPGSISAGSITGSGTK